MPEREFELYLSLLSRFLRLRPAQRDEVADELRDHLDQRLEELAARGLSREEAIRKALDEFGDAAELAKHFTQAAYVRRRRLIMRCTYGTIAALAASLFIATAFWPASPPNPVVTKAAAQDAGRATAPARGGPNPSPESDERAEIEAKLSQRLGVVDWGDITLAEALEKLSEAIGVDIVIDYGTLTDEGVATDSPIRKMSVKHARLGARAVLDLILEPVQLDYYIRDGVLIVTTVTRLDALLEVQIYNVRDLPTSPLPGAVGASRRSRTLAAVESAQPGTTGKSAEESTDGHQDSEKTSAFDKRSSLRYVIRDCVDPDTWDENGGPGSISESTLYEGLLFVNASPAVHRKTKRFLDELRVALRDGTPLPAGRPSAPLERK